MIVRKEGEKWVGGRGGGVPSDSGNADSGRIRLLADYESFEYWGGGGEGILWAGVEYGWDAYSHSVLRW